MRNKKTLFERRHYEALADWWYAQWIIPTRIPRQLKGIQKIVRWNTQVNDHVQFFANWLSEGNPKFKREEFIDRATNGR